MLLKVFSKHMDTALIRYGQTEDHVHHRRLAGPVDSKKTNDLAGADLEVKVVYCCDFLEALGQGSCLQDGRSHRLNGS